MPLKQDIDHFIVEKYLIPKRNEFTFISQEIFDFENGNDGCFIRADLANCIVNLCNTYISEWKMVLRQQNLERLQCINQLIAEFWENETTGYLCELNHNPKK